MGHRRSRVWGCAAVLATLAILAGAGVSGQSARRAAAEDLRHAYDTYRSMQRSSPHAPLTWQYLGPTNLSGRATDIAVAERGSSRRRRSSLPGPITKNRWKPFACRENRKSSICPLPGFCS